MQQLWPTTIFDVWLIWKIVKRPLHCYGYDWTCLSDSPNSWCSDWLIYGFITQIWQKFPTFLFFFFCFQNRISKLLDLINDSKRSKQITPLFFGGEEQGIRYGLLPFIAQKQEAKTQIILMKKHVLYLREKNKGKISKETSRMKRQR